MEWIGKSKKTAGAKGHTDYDVKVSEVCVATKTDPDKTGLAVVFRNKAYGIALALNAKAVKRSPIYPNSNRLYFAFESKDDFGVKLSKTPGSDQAYRSRFAFMNKTEAEIVRNVWVGEYSIKYDKEEGAHYIERKISK